MQFVIARDIWYYTFKIDRNGGFVVAEAPNVIDGRTISFDDLMELIDEIAEREGLSETAYHTLRGVIDSMRSLYGDKMNKQEAIKVISSYLQITRTGFVRTPVDIVEFIESPEYMNQKGYVRPAIMENLVNLFEDPHRYYEMVCGGAIGIGKNYTADMGISYILYRLSCLYSPQAYYGLAPGTSIFFMLQSKTLDKAKKVMFNQLYARIKSAGYFMKHFPPDEHFKSELVLPHNIYVVPISGTETAALGMNIFGGCLDELNFMRQVKKSKHTREAISYDQAEILYNTVTRRIKSRFMETGGRIPGKLFLLSSARNEGDFIERKIEEAKTNPHIYVMRLALWEALPPDKFSGEKFYIYPPSRNSVGGIYDETKDTNIPKEDLIAVPIEYKTDFERDFLSSIRDIAGIATRIEGYYFTVDKIQKANVAYTDKFGSKTIFRHNELVADSRESILDIVDARFLESLRRYAPFGGHVDLAQSEDSVGIAIGCVVGAKSVGYRPVLTDDNVYELQYVGTLPVYAVPGLLTIHPPYGGEIKFEYVRDILLYISSLINLKWVTLDRWQSVSLMQALKQAGIQSWIQSVDRTNEPYQEVKSTLNDGRLLLPSNTILTTELVQLRPDSTGKLDHPEYGSKDLSDALAGTVYGLSKMRSSYRGDKEIIEEEDNKGIDVEKEKQKSDKLSRRRRPSSGRRHLY